MGTDKSCPVHDFLLLSMIEWTNFNFDRIKIKQNRGTEALTGMGEDKGITGSSSKVIKFRPYL